jgi:hypothetical protein
MESKKINQLATELTPALSDLTIIGDPTTGISKKITLSQMASLFTGTVEEYPSLASFPLVGVADTIYIATDTNILYRWDTSLNAYAELSPNIVTSLVFSDANGFDGTISLVGSVATLTITTALTTGSVPFIGASGALSQDNANLFFDDTNNRLGINTNSPTTALDVFGSGIIGRVNGTSTNNAFLGFASAGTNKWSIGNVQSDHRFRIYNEATTSELVSVLQTGEFGIGIANPTTKLHIDGGASALIANLDANVSVAKSVSFRSDNSNRINLEVSGTESGSNVGADLFIRRYSDAGALLDTPLFIKRSTGNIGMGTTSPDSKLHVTGNIRVGASLDNSSTFIGKATATTEAFRNMIKFISTTTDDYLQFGTHRNGVSSDIRMTIDGIGNVGIGETAPASPLHVLSSAVGLLARFQSNQAEAQIRLINTGTSGRSYSIGSGASTSAAINGFYIFDETASVTRFVINSSGNVGIGTSVINGGSKLQVDSANGTAYTSNAQLRVSGGGVNNNRAQILFSDNNLSDGKISYYPAATEADRLFSISARSTETDFIIKGNGNVGIGMNSPNYTFHIDSNTTLTRFQITNSTTGQAGGVGLQIIQNGLDSSITNRSNGYLGFETNGTERMRIFADGVISMGMTTNQYARLAIKSNSLTRYAGLNLYALGNGNFIFMNHDNNVAWVGTEFGTGGTGATPLGFAPGGTERMRIDTSGNVTFGVTAAYDTALLWRQDFTGGIHGRIYANGTPRVYVISGESGGVYLSSGATSWTANSDERLKDINGEIENAVEKLSTLRTVNFSWKSDESKKQNLGLIAQDVEKEFPQLIDKGELGKTGEEEQTDKTEYLGVRYQELIPVLVAAIKELKAEIEILKAK